MKHLLFFFAVLASTITNMKAQEAFAPPGSVPPGTVVAFAGSQIPDGWKLCDGSELKATEYRALFKAIGTTWGNGNGQAGSFNLPDMRGMFLRGVDEGAGNDPDAAARKAIKNGGNSGDKPGSIQPFMTARHSHTESPYFTTSSDGYYYNSAKTTVTGKGRVVKPSDNEYTGRFRTNTSAEGGSETRPKNVYVYYIIKT